MANAPRPFENVVIVSDSIFSNGSDTSELVDNTWISIPGVVFDVVQGRSFTKKHSDWASMIQNTFIWPSPTALRKVVMVTSGNDLKSNRGRYTREWLAEEAIRGIHRAITTWKESSPPVSVFFVFLGSWKLHGAGFFDIDREHAKGNYERCKEEMLASAGALKIPTWDEPTDAWEKFEKTDDGWHFAQTDAPGIAAELRRMLGDVVLQMEAAPVRGPPWNESPQPPQSESSLPRRKSPQPPPPPPSESAPRERLRRWGRTTPPQAAAAETSPAEAWSWGGLPPLQACEIMKTWPNETEQYPFCTVCNKWSDDKHRASRDHLRRCS